MADGVAGFLFSTSVEKNKLAVCVVHRGEINFKFRDLHEPQPDPLT